MSGCKINCTFFFGSERGVCSGSCDGLAFLKLNGNRNNDSILLDKYIGRIIFLYIFCIFWTGYIPEKSFCYI